MKLIPLGNSIYAQTILIPSFVSLTKDLYIHVEADAYARLAVGKQETSRAMAVRPVLDAKLKIPPGNRNTRIHESKSCPSLAIVWLQHLKNRGEVIGMLAIFPATNN